MKPLSGRSIVVTRPESQLDALAQPLVEFGATVIAAPTVRIIDPDDDGEALRRYLERLPTYNWCVFTSVNTVERVFSILDDVAFHGVMVAAIGSGTAEALEAYGVFVDLVPDEYVAESLVQAFPEAPVDGGRVLLPRAAIARDVLPDGLRTKAWDVDVVTAYQTVQLPIDAATLAACRDADVVTFTAPSTVESFLSTTSGEVLAKTVACIGPVTAKALESHGISPDIVATEHTIGGLVDAIVAYSSRVGDSGQSE